MPETNSDINLNVKLKGFEEAEKNISDLKTQLTAFSKAFQLGNMMAQMDKLTNKFKEVGIIIDTKANEIRSSSGKILSVGEAANKVSASLAKIAQQATATKALSSFMAQFKKGGSDVDKFNTQLTSVELKMRQFKSVATGKIVFQFQDINTGNIISAKDAMKRVEESTITLTDRIKKMKQEFKTAQGIENFKMQLQAVGVVMDEIKRKGSVSLQFRDINSGQIVSAAEAMKRVEVASVGVVARIREIKAQFAETTYIEKFKQDMLAIGIIVDEIRSKSGAVSLRFTLNTGEVISATNAMKKLAMATEQAKMKQKGLNQVMGMMRGVAQGMQTMLRSLSTFILGIGLSTMFLGMQLRRTMETIARTTLDTYMKIVEGATFASRGILALGGAFTFLKFVVGDAIAEALLPFIPTILDLVEAFADFIDENSELVAGLLLVGIALGAIMFVAGQLIIPLSSFVGLLAGASQITSALLIPAFMALAGALGIGGWELLVIVIAGVIQIMLYLVVILVIIGVAIAAAVIMWQKDFNGFRNTVAGIVKSVAKFFADLFTNIYNFVKDIFKTSIPSLLNNFFSFFQNMWDGNFSAALANLQTFGINFVALMIKVFGLMIYEVAKVIILIYDVFVEVGAWILALIPKIIYRIVGLFQALVGFLIRGPLASLQKAFLDIGTAIVKAMASSFDTMANNLRNTMNRLIETFNKIFGTKFATNKIVFKTDTSALDRTLVDAKKNIDVMANKLALALVPEITPEMVKANDAKIDAGKNILVDALKGLSSGLNSWIEATLGATAINNQLNPIVTSLENTIKEWNGVTEKAITADYYTGSVVDTVGQIYTDSYKALSDMANSINSDVQATTNSTDAVKAFTDGLAGLPLEAIQALANALSGKTQTVNIVGPPVPPEVAEANRLMRLQSEQGAINVDATSQNTITMQELINTIQQISNIGFTAPMVATTTGATNTTTTGPTTVNTTVQVDMSGITATDGSVVIPKAQLERMMNDAVKNYMEVWTSNFKQGMNSYGV